MRTLHARIAVVAAAILLPACASTQQPLTIQQQGSFAVGGSVITAPGTFDPIRQGAYDPAGPDSTGQTLHGDHAYVFYQVPANARKLPLVFWHGHGQSGKTWETTAPDEQLWFGIFRLGVWPDFYPNVAFSREPEALNQFFRQMVPNTGPYDVQVNASSTATTSRTSRARIRGRSNGACSCRSRDCGAIQSTATAAMSPSSTSRRSASAGTRTS